MAYFFLSDQFCGCSGSSGPSNCTTYSSCSGRAGGYGFPAPNGGNGFLELRDVRLRPTVPLCWERSVAIRLSTVGFLSRSRCVSTLDIPISTLTIETEDADELVACEAAVSRLCKSFSSFSSGNLSGDAARSAFSRSRSTISIM